jgi:hypothetical protein
MQLWDHYEGGIYKLIINAAKIPTARTAYSVTKANAEHITHSRSGGETTRTMTFLSPQLIKVVLFPAMFKI